MDFKRWPSQCTNVRFIAISKNYESEFFGCVLKHKWLNKPAAAIVSLADLIHVNNYQRK